jgi:hypothetical protein
MGFLVMDGRMDGDGLSTEYEQWAVCIMSSARMDIFIMYANQLGKHPLGNGKYGVQKPDIWPLGYLCEKKKAQA